nr:hypothetical protein [Armatimonas sp.]
MEHALVTAVQVFTQELDAWWDAEEGMCDNDIFSVPPGRLVLAIHAHDPDILDWLVYFVARRALPCWEISCTSSQPRRIVEAMKAFLCENQWPNWLECTQRIPSPHYDCLYSETQSAADAVVDGARYLESREPRLAVCCISAAACAYDHVLLGDNFREWLLEVAIPVALEKREMTSNEQEALRQDPDRFRSA